MGMERGRRVSAAERKDQPKLISLSQKEHSAIDYVTRRGIRFNYSAFVRSKTNVEEMLKWAEEEEKKKFGG